MLRVCNVWELWDLAMQLSDLKSWRKSVVFFIIKRPSHVVHCRQEEERIHTYNSRRILAELATLSLEYVLGQSPNKLSATEVVYSSKTLRDLSANSYSFGRTAQIVLRFTNVWRSYDLHLYTDSQG